MRDSVERDALERSWRIRSPQRGAWEDLRRTVGERAGLSVIAADPWSGTTGLLEELREDTAGPLLLVDARGCVGAGDLGMAIADEAVRTFASDASASWPHSQRPDVDATFRVRRTLAGDGVAIDPLRTGRGDPLSILRAGIDAVVSLAAAADAGGPVLAIDHLGRMLEGRRTAEARTILDALRAAWQAHRGLDLIMVDFSGGPVSSALKDRSHPLFQAGQEIIVKRPRPTDFTTALHTSKAIRPVSRALLSEAAGAAGGVPALTWQVVDLAREIDADDPAARAFGAWQVLRAERATLMAREWDVLRAVHPAAQVVAAAVGVGLAPHSVVASKTADDALRKLRAVGMAWQPAPRAWALASPLLAAWAAEHLPPRALRLS